MANGDALGVSAETGDTAQSLVRLQGTKNKGNYTQKGILTLEVRRSSQGEADGTANGILEYQKNTVHYIGSLAALARGGRRK